MGLWLSVFGPKTEYRYKNQKQNHTVLLWNGHGRKDRKKTPDPHLGLISVTELRLITPSAVVTKNSAVSCLFLLV